MKNSLRRYAQIIFFVIFLFLLVQTEYKGQDTLGQPVRIFLDFDPLLVTAVLIAAEGMMLYLLGLVVALVVLWLINYMIRKFLPRLKDNKLLTVLFSQYIPFLLVAGMLVWALFPFGFERALPIPMVFGVVTALLTLLVGRVFCGWVCPMGAVLQFVSWLKKDDVKTRRAKNLFQPHQYAKYYILFGLLAAAVLGFQIVGLVDPISTIIRSFSLVISPLVNQAANGLYDLAYSTENDLVIGVSDGIYNTIAYPNVLSFNQPHFVGALFVAAFFILILALNWRRPRYWCRVLCPLGAFLGTISRLTAYRLQMRAEKCNSCGNCSSNCQGACDPEFKQGWRPSECFVCFHCVDSCPSAAVSFSFGEIESRDPETNQRPLDLKKRRAFQSVGAALIAVPLIRATEQYKHDVGGASEGPAVTDPSLIRPPGALGEPEFLHHCVRCGECMKVCPTNGLHPATLEAGVEGLWTPILVPQIGYCEYYCTLCGQVCPTGAIRELDVETKLKTVIGTAFFDLNRCLPYAFGVDCIVCEEHCPTTPKAIWFEKEERKTRPLEPEGFDGADGTFVEENQSVNNTSEFDEKEYSSIESIDDPYGSGYQPERDTLLKPRIDLELCIGCGICEKVCVVADEPAIRITAVGEERSSSNRILLRGSYDSY